MQHAVKERSDNSINLPSVVPAESSSEFCACRSELALHHTEDESIQVSSDYRMQDSLRYCLSLATHEYLTLFPVYPIS